ncbi:glutamyl-tRNA synthetase [Thermodesulfatator indicus DSM 15286]|uniref:Glutamate--tRNA ligase n=1 Tax=Thermodesulfatator indicus (strain DSM 15286 / JCM 11887 / CIR29812) TaxID=667014 RepID=F8A957_THEID|nr:glutamate--tRNA ligase [Thermodesulfatator indicus]AEH45189.1 glutamyl-tRNA synthetase [Thermodesulfatator indicus DSM 15286]
MSAVKTRFPPSPTGHLHLGGARTALFNWLFAKHHGGAFLLRFEDTDRERSKQEYVDSIKEALEWLELFWDEGPYFQTQRLEIYADYAQKLFKEGKAYYCECSPEVLEEKRKKALAEGRKPKYDGTCREKGLGPGPGRVLRFKCPQTGTTVVEDLIRGAVAFENQELDDFVLVRPDGIPTYQFAVVIDDLTMGITHVIRGDDHLSNTPKQILLFEALGATPPKYAHVPMILGPDGSRLSKRHGALSILAYRDEGYLAQAMRNYLVRLGWSYGDQEIFTLEEMIEKFDLSRVSKSPARFDPDKLLALNAHYIRQEDTERLAEMVLPFLLRLGIKIDNPKDEKFLKAVESVKPRARTLKEMAEMMAFYFVPEVEYEEKAARKFLKPDILPVLEELLDALKNMPAFEEKALEDLFRGLAEKHQLKLKHVAQPVRVALTGRTVSPGLFEIMDILGKETVIKRLEKALQHIREAS